MDGTPRLMESLVEFARRMTGGFDISEVLNDLATRVPEVLDIVGAGVSLVSGTRVEFATASSERTDILERVQGKHQAGPCVEAIRSGEDVLIADVRAEAHRWPEYVATASRVGILAVAAVPMHDGRMLGALDLYDLGVHTWTPDELATAHVFANIATGYLVNASDLERERRTVEQLQRALESRVVIEQAKGIVATTHGTSIDAAFLRLRRYARDHQATLREVAHAVVSLGLRP